MLYNPEVTQILTDAPPAALLEVASEFEQWLHARLETLDLPENLADAVRYGALGGGKRLRPVLVMLCCEAVGGDRRLALGPAAAMELIHCFSLVHDDLPAMDDDELRRGRPTLHVHAGEAMAILAGDAMMSLAFELVGEGSFSRDSAAAMTAELASATTRMIAGQVLDTLGGFSRGMSDQERLREIHRSKTGALLRASCRIGGICGGASTPQLRALTAYGESIGLMYQIVDDLIDVLQSPEHTGKATGKDHSAGKVTFPGVMGIEQSRSEVNRLRKAARDEAARLGAPADLLVQLCDYMAIRTR
jgi:geranylgeranyl diphosphate synthase type II